jgi:energy-coupling factor transporter ATP-binding protein EcfA2
MSWGSRMFPWWDRRGPFAPKRTPDAERAQIHIKRLVFSDRTQVELQRNSIVVLTGPNNVGKSTSLRETFNYLQKNRKPRTVISNITTDIRGTASDFRRLAETAGLKSNVVGQLVKDGYSDYNLIDIEKDFETHFVGKLPMSFFATYLNASERLSVTLPAQRIDYRLRSPEHPALWLELDDAPWPRIQAIFEKTFEQTIQINMLQGTYFGFNIVPRDEVSKAAACSSSRDYYEWINSYPTLESQGDGMRSFTGALLSILVHPRNIVLLDEPEAFLHPPQAKRLAETIAEETDNNSQVFLATHDVEIVKALLDSAGERVIIVRITRQNNLNKVTVLDHEQIAQLWRDPLLKTSAVLSSLFHEIAVLCEGETDARFFKVLLDATRGEKREKDCQFYHVGGKDRIAGVAKALRALGVPAIAIVDIDILADQHGFSRLFESLGGNPNDVQADLKAIGNAIAIKRKVTYGEFAERLEELAAKANNMKNITDEMIDSLVGIRRSISAWQQIKQVGQVAFNGEDLQAFDRLANRGKAVGLLINPEGELEGFCRTVSRSRKAEWLSKVIELDIATESDFASARKFAASIREALDAKIEHG